jgi:predicted RNA methylase
MPWTLPQKIVRISQQLIRILREEGAGSIMRKVHRRLSNSCTLDLFDERHGIDTSREVSLFELDIQSPRRMEGTRYQPSPVDVCHQLFTSLPVRYQDFTFIDLGAGKGRVLMVASQFPFRRLIGVEFARELVEIARSNLRRTGCNAEIVHADSAEYEFPWDNLILYLYYPFGPEVLHSVLKSVHKISATREVYLLYLNAKNSSCVEEFAKEVYELCGAKVYRFEQP